MSLVDFLLKVVEFHVGTTPEFWCRWPLMNFEGGLGSLLPKSCVRQSCLHLRGGPLLPSLFDYIWSLKLMTMTTNGLFFRNDVSSVEMDWTNYCITIWYEQSTCRFNERDFLIVSTRIIINVSKTSRFLEIYSVLLWFCIRSNVHLIALRVSNLILIYYKTIQFLFSLTNTRITLSVLLQ